MRLFIWRHRLYEILEQISFNDFSSRALNQGLIGLIVATLVATILETVPSLAAKYDAAFQTIEIVAAVVFTIEYFLRLWTAIEHGPLRHLGPLHARLRFATSLPGLIDLAAVLPFWLAFLIAPDFRAILVIRLIRFFKLTRYSPAMRSLFDAVYTERRALAGCFIIFCGTTIIAAALMHLAERHAQPEKFGTIPDAMWWAIVTVGTIGYGDAVPITVVGRMLAGVTIFIGLIMMALPIGIVATAFSNEIHRRDFVITWGILARIPLFSELTAAQIADVMKCLRAQRLEAGDIITRRGEPAHAMYLIADGEVEIKLHPKHVRLGAGHFFGEVAAIRRSRHSATTVALTTTRLLVLDAADLHSLMEREPQIASHIQDVARKRLGHELMTPEGDLVSEELVDRPADLEAAPKVPDFDGPQSLL
jgi:voltage-gated potassium channel